MLFWPIALFLFASYPSWAALKVNVGCESALLINSRTGKVLFAKNASQPMFPASCTKVAFALYAIKNHSELFNQKLICTQNALKSLPEAQKGKNNFANVPSFVLESDASHMGLKVGEEMSFYELLEATMVVSADDASNMIAETMGEGSIDKCVEEVNHFLASIGCKNTHFTNPHGLHHPDHVTTAYDLALMCQEAMKEPLFAKMAKMTCFERPKTNKQEQVSLRTTNRLLRKGGKFYYPETVGIKTGYHRRAGYCLASQAEKNGRALIAVVLNSDTGDERFQDTISLFNAAFQEEERNFEYFSAGPQSFERVLKGGKSPIKTETKESLNYSFYPSEEPKIECKIAWENIDLPLKKGSTVGQLQLIADGKLERKVLLYAADDVELTLLASLNKHLLLILIGFGTTILTALFVLKKRSS